MLREIDEFFMYKEEPVKSCLLALRAFILQYDPHITEAWKYKMPFYCYNGKMCCYLWTDKKTEQPYIGIVEGKQVHHPQLVADKRARMTIMHFDPRQDLPVDELDNILGQMVKLYQ